MAAMLGREWGGMGQNYLKSLFALGFQAFLITSWAAPVSGVIFSFSFITNSSFN